MEHLQLAPLLARRELWLLVSVGYTDPFRQERFQTLKDPAFRQRAIGAVSLLSNEFRETKLGPGEVSPQEISVENLFEALDKTGHSIETEYRKSFGLTALSPERPLCGTEFESNADISYRSQQLADIAGFYQAFGLAVSDQANERVDHITLEAEFLYVLLAKEAAAIYAEDAEAAEVCRFARREFFKQHVGWWLPALARFLLRIVPSPYYQQLAALTAALSALERTSLDLPRFRKRRQSRSSPQMPGIPAACSRCATRE